MPGNKKAQKKVDVKNNKTLINKDLNTKNTLFVRGIPDEATDNDFAEFFSEVGPVRHCFIVRQRAPLKLSDNDNGDDEDEAIRNMKESLHMEKPAVTLPNNANSSLGKSKGFGFVTFALAEDAEKAVTELKHVKMMGQRFLKIEPAMKKSLPDDMKADNLAQRLKIKKRNLEFSKKSAETGQAKPKKQKTDVEATQKMAIPKVLDSKKANKDVDDDDGVEIIIDKSQKDRIKRLPNASEGQTVFVRNIPLDATEGQISEKFQSFGDVLYCVFTRNQGTSAHRGTGFVCFKSVESCRNCLEEYSASSDDLVQMLNGANTDDKPAKSSSIVSVLTPELPKTAGDGSPFVVDGHLLRCSLAVSRKNLRELETERELSHLKDKRNLYLLREGVIFPDSAAARLLSSDEISKRMQSFKERKALLEKNPNLFVSKYRLSIRNMPLCVTEKLLKTAAVRATINFWRQIDSGERRPLDKHLTTEKDEALQRFKTSDKDKKYAQARVTVKQVKVQHDEARRDSTTGKPRSKGFGFIEFSSHADAIACLRSVNNADHIFDGLDGMPSAFTKKKLIAEFAIENRKVLLMRSKRQNMKSSKKPDSI